MNLNVAFSEVVDANTVVDCSNLFKVVTYIALEVPVWAEVNHPGIVYSERAFARIEVQCVDVDETVT